MVEIVWQNVLSQYLLWHFFDIPRAILKGWKNFLYFNLNYFSVPILLRTFFSHWRRYRYSYGRGLNIGRYFEAFTFNLMSRGVGMALRSVFIILGLLVEIFIIFVGIAIFLGWFVLPLLLILGLIFGIKLF